MDKNVKVLIVLGAAGVGIYILYKGGYLAQWFPQLFPAAAGGPTIAPTSTIAQAVQAQAPIIGAPIYTPPVQTTTTRTTAPASSAPSCPQGQTLSNGVCISATPPPPAAVAQAISQQMLNLAGGPSVDGTLNLDQWCYYYTQVTANDCPVDPGSIDPGVYQGAGVINPDGSTGDRTTPTYLSTWLAIMQLEAPQLGLSGIGDLGYLAHRNNAWLT